MRDSEFEIVVWGASGFTGRLVAEYLSEYDIKWAIAGRNQKKLEQIRASFNIDESIPIIIADSEDTDSLQKMVARTRVVCTTVGPYAKYGSQLLAACVEAGVHYCDLTGEVLWMHRMIETYHARAEQTGAMIVHTCGFDSIPFDLGVHFLQQQMKERRGVFAEHIKCRVVGASGGMSGGTAESMMNMMDEAQADPALMDMLAEPYLLNPPNLPVGDDVNDQTGGQYDADFRQWTGPFVMAAVNTRVVRRSHALKGFPWGQAFRYDESMLMGAGPAGFIKASLLSAGSMLFMLAAFFSPTRALLRKLVPSPGEGPTEEQRLNGYFDIELMGLHPDQSSLTVKVTGDRDPGYGSTSKMLAQCALCLAQDELDCGGGVLTPSVAMGDKLLVRLQQHAGLDFRITGD